MPASPSSRAVPPVDRISMSSSFSPRAKSTSPRLSDTDKSARRMRTSPGWMTSVGLDSVASDISSFLNQHPARILWIDPHRPAREEPDRAREQLMLDRVDGLLDALKLRRIRKLQRLLQDDRPAVDALVHEVHGHASNPHPVIERFLDRMDAAERGQERGMDVDDAALKAADELGAQDLHEPGEHEQVDLMRLEPVAEQAVPQDPVAPVVGRVEDARLDPGLLGALEPTRARAVRPHADDLDALPPMDLVQDRLEVGPLPRDQDRDPEAHAATDAGGTLSTGRVPPVVASLFCSISSSIRARMSARRMWEDT